MIKVLIVDDLDSKAKSIKSCLNSCGVENNRIDVASTAAEARKKLTANGYELMLLDLILPSRNGENPSASVGLELLKQIVEDEDLPSPRTIVGTTADSDALKQYDSEFRRLTTQIIHVSPAKEEWRSSLTRLISGIFSADLARNSYDFDICFITALRDPELEAVLSLPVKWEEQTDLGNGSFFWKGVINQDEAEIKLVCAYCPQMGLVSSSSLTSYLVGVFKPRLVLMPGICGGIDKGLKIGDLVVADRSWDWQSGKWLESGEFQPAPEHKEASSELVSLARELSGKVIDIYKDINEKKPANVPAVKLAPMVSGSAVVESLVFQEKFKAQHRKAAGVDMECYGVYFAASASIVSLPKYLCVKGVSDLANSDKSDDFQSYCSHLSANFLLEIALRYVSRLYTR
ncbi:response regulator [Vreelandella olivaria]|uniref:phosphorylase family protein n=1 Tax=Vreelandella olivaria TaxID=390919 RepID=UPI00201F3383|nr:response regulator [Halomonas olivaria]